MRPSKEHTAQRRNWGNIKSRQSGSSMCRLCSPTLRNRDLKKALFMSRPELLLSYSYCIFHLRLSTSICNSFVAFVADASAGDDALVCRRLSTSICNCVGAFVADAAAGELFGAGQNTLLLKHAKKPISAAACFAFCLLPDAGDHASSIAHSHTASSTSFCRRVS